jgi:hypothetical protein
LVFLQEDNARLRHEKASSSISGGIPGLRAGRLTGPKRGALMPGLPMGHRAAEA